MRRLIFLWAFLLGRGAGLAQQITPLSQMVAMRDGVALSTDVYLPHGEGRFPVLVCRTPYGKAGVRGDAVYLANRGYVVLAQDCRGRFASQGKFYGFINEGQDGYDTIEWAASQPWSDGQVGTFGASYLAWDQYFASMLQPPHLKAMFALVGGAKFYDEYAYPGGIPNLGWPVWILKSAQTSPQAKEHPAQAAEMLELLQKTPVPWLEMSPDKRAEILRGFPDHERMYADFLAHTGFDSYWKQRGFYTAGYYDEMKDVPTFFLTGWYDYFADGMMENFTRLSHMQHTMKRLLVGPWPHATGEASCGDATFGEAAAVDQRALMADWFDHWMKGKAFRLVSPMPVQYFRMGGGDGSRNAKGKLVHSGEWLTSLAWPPAGGGIMSLYLRENSRLQRERPGSEPPSSFDFDPHHPVPTVGGRYGLGAWTPSCAQDGTMTRPDLLSFQTEPLQEDLDVTGPVRASLWIETDAPSTDFAAKLMDVYPDGYALTLADGAMRIQVTKPREPQKITVDMGSVSNLFVEGHSVRLYVTSSNFPKLEPNRYSAHQIVLHDGAHPSTLDLTAQPVKHGYGAPVKTTVMVPMRDGVKLSTDVYVPAREGKPVSGKFPVLVTRSPYNKNGESGRGNFFARHGYVFVAQDTRGRYKSEGEPYPLVGEGRDGYDTIEWAAAQPWSDGNVGTTGASYLAMDQYASAIERPPHLSAMYAAVGSESFYNDSAYRGGIPSLGWPVWLLLSAATDPHADPAAAKHMADIVKAPEKWLAQSRDERAKLLSGFPAQLRAYDDFYSHPDFDAYWRQPGFDTADFYQRMKDVPMLFVSGWYDTYADATLRNFTSLRAMQRSPKRLIMGPWPHGYGKTQCGDADFGAAAELDEMPVQLDWFDHWLKGLPLRDPDANPITYFRMGGSRKERDEQGKLTPGGTWLTTDSWPPQGSRSERWYLGNGKHLELRPAAGEFVDRFFYDPADPVETRGARYGAECIVNQNQKRDDILSYSSEPLPSPKAIAGAVRVMLWASSDAPSADFTAKLIDVYPDGYAAPLLDGATRIRPITRGQAQQVNVELGSTCNLFQPGHRIRIDISGSSFPKIEPNPNASHDVIYHGAHHNSYVELTVTSR